MAVAPTGVVTVKGLAPGPAPAAAPEVRRMRATPAPDFETAGAETCTLLSPVDLGPGAAPTVGFGEGLGMAAWKAGPTELSLRVVAPDGKPQGNALGVTVAADLEPRHVLRLRDGFLVLLRRWDWKVQDLQWFGVFVGATGTTARPPVDLALSGMDVDAVRAVDDAHVGLVARPGLTRPDAAKSAEAHARWQTIAVDGRGGLTSSPGTASLDDVMPVGRDRWEPAELGDHVGWVVMRDDEPRAQGIFGGLRLPARGATYAGSAVQFDVVNAATPPPPPARPGGRIYEAMAEPELHRTRAGSPLGKPVRLEAHGNPVGSHGIAVSGTVAWSGTHSSSATRSRCANPARSCCPSIATAEAPPAVFGYRRG